MSEEKALDLDIRRRIYECIVRSPGLHEREISRVLTIPLSTLDYHLFYLKKRNLIIGKSDGRYTRFYVAGEIGIKDKNVLSVLRQKVTRSIIMFLLLHPGSNHREISEYIHLAASTTSFHLNKLVDLGIITRTPEGRTSKYAVVEPDYLSDLLIIYQKSFVDKAVDRFIDLWLEINPDKVRKKEQQE